MKGKVLVRWTFPLVLLVLALVLAGCNPFSQGSGSSETTGQESASGATTQKPTTGGKEAQRSASGGGGDQVANSNSQGGQQGASQNGRQKANSSQGGGQQASAENAGPQKVLLRYYKAQNARNWRQAYQLFSSQSKQKVSLEQYSRVFSATSPFTIKYSIISTNVQGDTAKLRITRTLTAQGQSQGDQVVHQLVRENGNWRLVMGDKQAEALTKISAQLQQAGQS